MAIPRATRRRMLRIAEAMKIRAGRMLWDGKQGYVDGVPLPPRRFWLLCCLDVEEVGTRLLFSRDAGHHTSGWLKNPDYERCWHLSLSKAGPLPEYDTERRPELRILGPDGRPAGESAGLLVGPDLKPLAGAPRAAPPDLDPDLEAAWVDAFFGEEARYVWRESAKSELGRKKAVWHYRVFADENWAPIIPRGEVYSTEFTELGWQSWSELHAAGGPVVESTVDPS